MKKRAFLGIISIILWSIVYSQETLVLYDMYSLYGNDTINRIDSNNIKQGYWIEYKLDNIVFDIDYDVDSTCKGIVHKGLKFISSKVFYPKDYTITFAGKYIDDQKVGVWKSYYENGNLWKKALYQKGRLIGEFKVFYEDGKPKIIGKQLSDTLFEINRFNEQGLHISKKITREVEIKL